MKTLWALLEQLAQPRVPEAAAAGAASGAGAVAASVSDLAVQVVGVPLPVLLAAFAGACLARAYADKTGFLRALAIIAGWTLAGCALAPVGQAAALWAGAKWLSLELTVPGGILAAVAFAVASFTWWWPLVWPFLRERLPGGKGAAGGGQ